MSQTGVMPLTALTYYRPVRRSVRPPVRDYDLLEQANRLSEEGQPAAALGKVFQHLFPQRTIPDLAEENFKFVQGSSRVTVKLDGDELSVRVPLVKLPAGGTQVAALRHVLSVISSTGQLHQPRIHGDDLYLEFRDKLSRLHPAKMLEVLRRMPYEADTQDDWLIGQFQAQPLERAEIRPLDDSELGRAEEIWRAHFSEVEDLSKESQRKRSVWFLNEVTAYTMNRIVFALPLSGYLGARLAEAGSTFNDGNEDPLKRESSLGKFVKEMKLVPKEELQKSVGHAEYALPPVADGAPNVIADHFGESRYMETIDGLRRQGQSLDAALGLIGSFNYMLARYAWPEPIEEALKSALEEASQKPFREAAHLLFDHARALVEGLGAAGEEDEEEEEDAEEGEEEEAGEEEQS
jgi:hypothetical protein